MRYIAILLICFLSFLMAKPSSLVIGMSETMGIYGFLNANYYLDDLNPFFITAGTFIIPTIGGVGLGWKHNYSQSKVSIFTSASCVCIYILPALCSTDDCGPKFDMLLSASTGIDIQVMEKENFDLYFQSLVLVKKHIQNFNLF